MSHPITLNYKVLGEGQPVVVLHGLFGMLDNLQLFAKGLADKEYMVYLVDQRDHGRSPHTDEFSYPVLANDLLHFTESQWLHQTMLIGHSMGGKTTLQFLVDHPGIVTKAVVIDIGIKTYIGGHENIISALESIPLDKITSREEVQNLLMDKIRDLGTVLFLMKNLSRDKDTLTFEWKMNLPLLKKNYHHILSGIHIDGTIDTDILFVRGEKSNYIEDGDLPMIKQKCPNASFVTIPDAGHWVHADNLPALLDEIITFLET